MAPLVSILIPAFNAEEFIGDTLRSALAQTWPRTEVIVIDDGSKDSTAAIAESFASTKVKVVRQDNQGAAAARNRAMTLAQGDYLQWLDADDLLSVDKITNQIALITECPEDVLASCGWAYFRYRPHRARFRPGPLWADLDPIEWMLRKWETNSHMQTATWLVSRLLSERAGPWNTHLSSDDDGEYFARVVACSARIRFAHDAKVYYRISPAASRLSYLGKSDKKLEAMLRGMNLQIALLRSIRDDQRTRRACSSYLQTWIPEFECSPQMAARINSLASSWGAQVTAPRFSWKYDWIRKLFGPSAARSAQLRYNDVKSSAMRSWDRCMYTAEGATIDVASL